MSPTPSLTMWALRDSRNLDALYQHFEHWSDQFRQALRTPDGPEAVAQLMRYFYVVIPDSQHARFRAIITRHVPEVDTMEQTIGEALIEQGFQQGREIGHEQGLRQGREEARLQVSMQVRQQTLLRLLSRKFGKLPPGLDVWLLSATSEQLDTYLERVLFAPSLVDVFEIA